MLVFGTALSVLVAVLLVALTGAAGEAIEGISGPGVVTSYGVTVARVLAEIAAVVTIGSLLLAAFLVPPQRSGTLAADGYAALSTAGVAAWAWFIACVASVFFSAADASGRPVGDLLEPQVFVQLIDAVEQPKAWLFTAFAALLLALGCRLVLSWGWTAVLFFVSVGGLVPVAVTGHSATGGSHDVATNSLLIHLLAAALWVGGLIALVALGRRAGPDLPLAARRFSRLALGCWIAMAASGVVNALVRLPPSDVLTTDYGLLVVAKITALGVLGVFGQQQRTRGVRRLAERGSKGTLMQLAGVEVLIMFVTFGIAAALARTPPPGEAAAGPSRTELLIGYDLDGAPSVVRLLFDWRFDLIYGTAAIGLAVLYLVGVRKLRRRGDAWPVGRTVAWLAGCATILIATSSGVGAYSPAMFSVHMGAHMLLSMVAPVLLVLGGAVTLALRALPPAGKASPPGMREWLLAFVRSPISRALTHPIVALALFVGSFYALYFSGLFDAALYYHWAHLAMNAHFLLVGYVFFWPLIGVDPAPRRLPPLGRLGLMFAAMPFHAFFGVILMNSQTVIAEDFYRSLDLPWVGDLLTDQNLGGGIAWASGELPALLVLIALMVQWAQADERAGRRMDRKAAAGGEDDLAAYNAMLKQLADQGSDPRS
ncbi:MAG: copper resistance protein CopD [Actinophytocola sp.]|nr:copper resistance protein CopD [Actinophytocola sp.]